MIRSFVSLTIAAILVSGCAGRDARDYQVTKEGDSRLDCAGISREFYANESLALEIIRERTGQNVKNVAVTAASVVFLPSLFFLDLKGAERRELSSLKARNHVLADIAASKKCPKPQSRIGTYYDHYDTIIPPKDES